tara:strand:- start:3926 stop:4918 length:993 start_codon:yes stop_codon:yes gene_type:complete
MISIIALAEKVGGLIEGDSDLVINGIGDLKNSPEGFLSFLSDPRYYDEFKNSKSQAVIVNHDFSGSCFDKTLIRVDNPVYAYIQILELFNKTKNHTAEIHKTAIVSDKSNIGKNVYIGPYTIIEDNVSIGDFSYISASCHINANVIIGESSRINSNVSIYNDTLIGSDVIIESGSVIGSHGFGLTFHNGENHIIPHLGKVIINDKVWIGSNCSIDRGTITDTIIGEGTKMDNLIQIAHNVKIGKHCVIAGHTAIAGSTTIGNYVTIAGKVGIIGHLNIGDKCTVASMSQVTKSLKGNSFVSGIPARDHKSNLKLTAQINKLDTLFKNLKK